MTTATRLPLPPFLRSLRLWLRRPGGLRWSGERELREMSDRELSDLGIGRSEVGCWLTPPTCSAPGWMEAWRARR